ncbi:MAG: hypothetical protein J2P34_10630, partial [Actinobacteria bacterium]|nr:hypothetical protein [Actinomycetota bacterium]
IPGGDIVAALLLIAFGATVLAAIGRFALAATGNGSWLEFGLDVLSAVTLGFGSFAASPALGRAAESATEAAGESGVEKYFGSTVGRLIGESRATDFAAQWAKDDAEAAATAAQKAPMLERAWNTFKAGGDFKDMLTYSKITGLVSKYGIQGTKMATAVADGDRALAGLRLTAGSAGLFAGTGVIGSGGEIVNMQGQDVFRVHIPLISDLWDQGVHDTTHAIPGWHVAVSNAGG